jgi:hypothetical protein
MSGGNKGFVAAAVFGLIVSSAGIGSLVTSEGAYKPNGYPHYQSGPKEPAGGTLSTIPVNGVRFFQEKEPCYQPGNSEQSGLCAQWRAADAAEQAAQYAKWQLLVSLLGVIGLGATLWYNQRAIAIAGDANLETRRIGEAQSRCYLTVSEVNIEFSEDGEFMVIPTVANSGQSPAIGVNWHAIVALIYENKNHGRVRIDGSVIATVEDIGANSSHQFLGATSPIAINAEAAVRLRSFEEVGILVRMKVSGKDVFGNPEWVDRAFILLLHSTPQKGMTATMHSVGGAAPPDDLSD